ncbi:Vacuolar protein sorting-associated protein 26A [Vitis vinifera]|uniref:Vacuolar protein sorting-associated protein 26A n=1 Tax=Vitis vinifera TaxID=29760 RepID=A0A438I1W6_VITVI|nr:Vacuolar protein sorting-associated protein 26A [Vitis vinifera]
MRSGELALPFILINVFAVERRGRCLAASFLNGVLLVQWDQSPSDADFPMNPIKLMVPWYTGSALIPSHLLRYILKVTVGRNFVSNIVEYQDFVVHNYTPLPSINNSIKMEVGIEDCLHIEFEYSKSKYHLKDVIIGKIYFLLVRIKMKNMELEIRRRESTGSGPNTYVETETLAKFEVMDGAPVRGHGLMVKANVGMGGRGAWSWVRFLPPRTLGLSSVGCGRLVITLGFGESIPIRLFLSPYELTPTYRNINNKFSVKYFLNLVLVDDEDRRYFKQQEITVYRLLETS